MTIKIFLRRAGKFVLGIRSIVLALLGMGLIFINTIFAKKTAANQIRSYLEKRIIAPLTNGGHSLEQRNDTIPFRFAKEGRDGRVSYLVSGIFLISDTSITFSLDDSLFINYRKWNVSSGNRISYSATGITVNEFLLTNDTASISIVPRQNIVGSPIEVNILNLDIRDISGFISADTLFTSGLTDAKIVVSEFGKAFPEITSTATIRNAAWMQQPVGNIQVMAQMKDENSIHTTLAIAENENAVSATADLFLDDGKRQLDARVDINKLQVAVLTGFLKNQVSRPSGSVKGSIALKGNFKHPEWSGTLQVDTAAFTIDQFGTNYKVENQQLSFDYPAISFNRFTVKDSLGQITIINGNLCAKKPGGFDVDLQVGSRDFIVMNTSRAINNQVYGFAVMDADVSVTGTPSAPVIKGDVYLNKKTNITLVLPEKNNDKEAARTVVRFLKIVNDTLPAAETFQQTAAPVTNVANYLNRQLNVTVDKEAALSIIIDPSTGDELKVQGSLLFNPGLDPGKNIVMAGTYQLDTGYYELSYQFLKKRFNVLPGSTITFDGRPSDARINIKAVYIASTTAKDLLGNEVGAVAPPIARSFNQDIPFRVLLFLNRSLRNPAISFDIRMPESGNISNILRSTIDNKLVQVKADTAATNKQVFALLALNRFVGEQSTDFFRGNGSDFTDITRESVSKFLSAALDQVASDLFRGINTDLNLNSYKDFTISDGTQKTDLNVEVSKNFLNDRLSVTVGQNFGIESQDGSTKASQQKASRFLPDVTVNYKLSTDGKYMFRSYRKNPFEVVLDGYVMETGVGFIFTIDYDRVNELFTGKGKKAGK